MKKRGRIALAAAAVVMLICVSIPGAMAYFTANDRAEGSVPVELGYQTVIEEPQVEDWTKHIVITSDTDSKESCYVRAKAIVTGDLTLTYSGEGWSEGEDGFWNYDTPLAPGESTKELLVKIEGIPEDAQEGDVIDVPVVYESTKVLYNEDGSPQEADWSMSVDKEGSGD